ncbi:MAG: hypothetical protein WA885_14950 [Phormidesmis sp.]
MNKFTTAVVITANLFALQTLGSAPVAQAQAAQKLAGLEAAGLIESTDGMLEIPGVGGESQANLNPDLIADVVESDEQITEPVTEALDRTYQSQQTNACSSSEFVFFTVCWPF